MIDLRINMIVFTDLEYPSMVPMIHGVTETKILSMIRRVDDGRRVEKSLTESTMLPK